MIDSKVLQRGVFVLAATFFALAGPGSPAAAEDPRDKAPGHMLYGDPAVPDISGLWLGTFTAVPGQAFQVPIEARNLTRWAPWPPPLTPPYRKVANERIEAAKAGRQLGDIGSRCLPFGLPRMLTSKVYQDEIIQTPGVVSIFIFGTFPIMIWTDGRPHPKDLKPSYNGHSIGYWLGDTLYVDTVGIIDTTPLESGAATPHSGKLHMKTTIQPVAPDTLHFHVTLYDDEAFTEPMVTTNIWRRKSGPNWEILDDISCFENNKTLLPDESGTTGFKTF